MLSGVLLVDKPKGITSMEVVEGIKKRFKLHAGHAGTLDPLATGLLIVLLGEATKFSMFFMMLDKAYRVVAQLGIITDTYDAEGEVLERKEIGVDCKQVEEALWRFTGSIEQKPPPYSAKKLRGKRAYELARSGQKVEIKPVRVKVYRAELLRCELPFLELCFEVSSGTYIRSLVHDLGLSLSCGGHVVELRRISIGRFSVEKAIAYHRLMSLEDIGGITIPVDEALDFLPKLSLSGALARRVKTGGFLKVPQTESTYLRLYEEDSFLGVGLVEDGKLRPYRMLSNLSF
ncbi:MAG: tRNA pseudouridine(55) synthase TruB [Acidobacteria bacterium]|jgi:tRNA pseudouridine55 synthase|nr:MAG: tRNA pseudouridine(55) synthase TruB [Acidobacteriota bacterium]